MFPSKMTTPQHWNGHILAIAIATYGYMETMLTQYPLIKNVSQGRKRKVKAPSLLIVLFQNLITVKTHLVYTSTPSKVKNISSQDQKVTFPRSGEIVLLIVHLKRAESNSCILRRFFKNSVTKYRPF